MTPYRIKKHRKRGHHGSHMALVPFIDMLTMLVVFLLLHSSDVEILPNTKNITIPQSVAELKPRETVVIMVTTDDLLVNGRSSRRSPTSTTQPHQLVIEPLRLALKEQADTSLRTAAQEDLADREVTIMGDKGTPFAVLKRVMATATAADYGKVSLAVIQREVAPGAAHESRTRTVLPPLRTAVGVAEESERKFKKLLRILLIIATMLAILIALLPSAEARAHRSRRRTARTRRRSSSSRSRNRLRRRRRRNRKKKPEPEKPKPDRTQKPVEKPKPNVRNQGMLALADELAALRDQNSISSTRR